MRESYAGLFTGIALAIILVYLFLVMNFQSWIDPLIVLMAVPFALAACCGCCSFLKPHERTGTDGDAHVHRFDHREQYFGGELRQSTHGGGRRSVARLDQRGLHTSAAGPHDGRAMILAWYPWPWG